MFSGELSTPNLWSVQDSSPGTLQTFWESGKVENSPKIAGESEGLVVTFLAHTLRGDPNGSPKSSLAVLHVPISIQTTYKTRVHGFTSHTRSGTLIRSNI